MKLLKILGIVILTLLIGLGVLVWQLDSIVQQFKPELEKKITAAVKAPVKFDTLRASIFPRIALNLEEVSLQGEETGVEVSELLLKTSLADLLTGEVTVSEFILKDASARLVRNKDGSLALGGLNFGGKKPAAQSGEEAAASSDSSISFNIDSASIENASLSFIDRSVTPEQTLSIAALNASVEEFELAGSGKIEVSAQLLDAEQANFKLAGTVGNPLQGKPLNITLDLAPINLDTVTPLLKAYKVQTGPLRYGGNLALNVKTDLRPEGLVALTTLDATGANLNMPGALNKEQGFPLKVSVETLINLLSQTVSSKNARLTLGSSTVDFPFSVTPNQTGIFNLSTSALAVSDITALSPAAAELKPEGSISSSIKAELNLGDPKAAPIVNGSLGLISVKAELPAGEERTFKLNRANGEIHFVGDRISVKELELIAENQKFAVDATVKSLDKPIAAFSVRSPKLSLFPLIKPFAPDQKALENSVLNEFKLSGSYATVSKAGSVSVVSSGGSLATMALSKLELKTKVGKDRFELLPSVLGIAGGTINAKAMLGLGENKDMNATISGSQVDAELVSKAFIPLSPIYLSGTMEKLSVPVQGRLDRMPDSLSGNPEVRLVDGAIEGINIIGEIIAKVKGIPGMSGSMEDSVSEENKKELEGNKTAFDSLQALTQIASGKINLRSVSLVHSLYELDGTGWIAFSGEMNVQAKARLTPEMTEEMILKKPKLKLLRDARGNIVIPVVIRKKDGRMLVLPDVEDLIKRAAANVATEAAGRALDKALGDKGKDAGKVLDSLFGG